MKRKYIYYFFIAAIIGSYSGVAAAQPNDNADDRALDVTMEVMEEGERPDSAMEDIELPEAASQQGVEGSARGLETANEAREQKREFGRERAQEARQYREEARQEAGEDAEQARGRTEQNIRDNVSRDRMDNMPDDVRENVPDDVRDRVRDTVRDRTPGQGGNPGSPRP
ncbi:MAG: hypothetical protein ACLFV2_08710 [Desulfurivibrionaceae bacterium]